MKTNRSGKQANIQTIFQSFGLTLALDLIDGNNEKGWYTRFASENDMFMIRIHLNLSRYFR